MRNDNQQPTPTDVEDSCKLVGEMLEAARQSGRDEAKAECEWCDGHPIACADCLQKAKDEALEAAAQLIAKWRSRRPCHGEEECCCHGICADELETLLRAGRALTDSGQQATAETGEGHAGHVKVTSSPADQPAAGRALTGKEDAK